LSGESASVTNDRTDQWTSTTLPRLLDEYTSDDIYNADESGLFYRMLPDKSLVMKCESYNGGKRSRLTILPRANMSGTDKLPLLVISKSAKPRCFKGEKLFLTNKANQKH